MDEPNNLMLEDGEAQIDAEMYPEFHKKMRVVANGDDYNQTQPQKIQCLYEAREWMMDHIDAMQLKDKNVFIIIGASRTGKGTLMSALMGNKMKLIRKADVSDLEISSSIAQSTQKILAHVDENDQPVKDKLISFQYNSHTLKPKIVADPPQYGDEFVGLDGWYGIDFPGMFDSKGPEIDTAVQLALQKILLEAKKTKVLVLVSAFVFQPEGQRLLKIILDKLHVMFKEPEKHTIIGICKTQLVKNSLGEEDEVLGTATGEQGEILSFKDWKKPFPDKDTTHIMVVEADNIVHLCDLVLKLQFLKPIKKFVKKGFLEDEEVKQMFEVKDFKKGMKKKKVGEWIHLLTSALEDCIPCPPDQIDDIVLDIEQTLKEDRFNKEKCDLILRKLNCLIYYQKSLSEQWNSLEDPYKIKTVIGLLDNYQAVNQIMNDPRHQNPSLTSCLYQIDDDAMFKVRKSLLSMRFSHLNQQIKQWIENCQVFIQKDKYQSLKTDCQRILNIYADELTKLGVDVTDQLTVEKSNFFDKIADFFRNLYSIVTAKKAHADDQQALDDFKEQINHIMYYFIKLDLDMSENALLVTIKRSTRVRAIIQHQRKLKDQTEIDIELEIQQMQEKIFVDQLKLNTEYFRSQLYGEQQGGGDEEITFSCTVSKVNRWEQRSALYFLISNYGQIDLLTEERKKRYSIKIQELNGLTWVVDDLNQANLFEIIINNKVNHDYKVECDNIQEKEMIFQAIKFLYWKFSGVNLAIYTVPKTQIHLAYNDKSVPKNKRLDVPDKFRVPTEDIYYEQKIVRAKENQMKNELEFQQKTDSTAAFQIDPGYLGDMIEEEENKEDDVYDLIMNGNIDYNDFRGELSTQHQKILLIENKMFQQSEVQVQQKEPTELVQVEAAEEQVILDADEIVDDEEEEGDGNNSNNDDQSIVQNVPSAQVSLKNLKHISLLGKGTQGKVFLVKNIDSNKLYSMKVFRKDALIMNRLVQYTINEKKLLQEFNHPFVINLEFSFQTETKLFIGMPFIPGGDFFTHMRINKKFPEEKAKFYCIQIAMALGYLHKKNIVYRDLKGENIMIDKDGYLKLIDFGIAKKLQNNCLTQTFCGTPEYMAPEMVQRQEYSFMIDWWTLGIIAYEMMVGFSPFYTGNNYNQQKLSQNILMKKIFYPNKEKHGIDMSHDAINFIDSLLNKDPQQRLGSQRDVQDVVGHPWFNNIDKGKLLKKKIELPDCDKPKLSKYDEIDLRYFDAHFRNMPLRGSQIQLAALELIRAKQDIFSEFDN